MKDIFARKGIALWLILEAGRSNELCNAGINTQTLRYMKTNSESDIDKNREFVASSFVKHKTLKVAMESSQIPSQKVI